MVVSSGMLGGPPGFSYHPAILDATEEGELARRLETLDFAAVTMRGKTARRRAKHFGWVYGYESWRITPGPPIPDFLDPVRRRAARLAGVSPEDLVEVLVNAYPPGAGIGWHRDAPQFGVVIGVSLLGECRLRFQRGRGGARQTRAVTIAPRSAYVLDGEARYEWQHTLPPTKTLRYSVTFRTLQTRAGGVSPRVESAVRAGEQSAKDQNDGDHHGGPQRQRERGAQEHADERAEG
jgi:alkylated DNA repair dioxygenase AlkB